MKKKKLALKRQSLLPLDPKRLREVQGGAADAFTCADCPPTGDINTVISRLTCPWP